MPKKRPKSTIALATTSDLAEALGCDVRTIHRMVADGRLTPLQKMPGKRGAYLFDADDLADLIPADSRASA